MNKYVFIGFLLIAGYFLITEHRAHVIEFLPFVLLAACPLLHLFHRHGGHGGHGDAGKEGEPRTGSEDRKSGDAQHRHH
jgi:hypothetical protein